MFCEGWDHTRDRDRANGSGPIRGQDWGRTTNQRPRSRTGSRVNTCPHLQGRQMMIQQTHSNSISVNNRRDMIRYQYFVKLADKTGCFMQIADNILIFLLTTRSMLLSHCHCQAAPGTSVNHNKIQIKLLTKLWRWSIAIQVILNLNNPILLLLAHGFYIRNTFRNWM